MRVLILFLKFKSRDFKTNINEHVFIMYPYSGYSMDTNYIVLWQIFESHSLTRQSRQSTFSLSKHSSKFVSTEKKMISEYDCQKHVCLASLKYMPK